MNDAVPIPEPDLPIAEGLGALSASVRWANAHAAPDPWLSDPRRIDPDAPLGHDFARSLRDLASFARRAMRAEGAFGATEIERLAGAIVKATDTLEVQRRILARANDRERAALEEIEALRRRLAKPLEPSPRITAAQPTPKRAGRPPGAKDTYTPRGKTQAAVPRETPPSPAPSSPVVNADDRDMRILAAREWGWRRAKPRRGKKSRGRPRPLAFRREKAAPPP